jgi:hypothetical protein
MELTLIDRIMAEAKRLIRNRLVRFLGQDDMPAPRALRSTPQGAERARGEGCTMIGEVDGEERIRHRRHRCRTVSHLSHFLVPQRFGQWLPANVL